MSQKTQLSYTTAIALITALVSLGFSLILWNQNANLESQMQDVLQNDSLNSLLKGDLTFIDEHVSTRIDTYIQGQRQKKIDRKFEQYSLAEANTAGQGHIYGNLQARFTLVEYSDLECPYCKRYHEVPKKLVEASNGLLNWQWKHFPLGSHNPVAFQEAVATECAAIIGGNQAFWVYLQEIYDATKGNGQGAGDLIGIAERMGLDGDEMYRCFTDETTSALVQQDIKKAQSLQINSTPMTFVVNNATGQYITLQGLQQPEAIMQALKKFQPNQQ